MLRPVLQTVAGCLLAALGTAHVLSRLDGGDVTGPAAAAGLGLALVLLAHRRR